MKVAGLAHSLFEFLPQRVAVLTAGIDLDGQRRRTAPPYPQHLAAERKLIPGGERRRCGDACSTYVCTVSTAEILDSQRSGSDRDPCVTPRNRGAIDDQRAFLAPSRNVLAVGEREGLLQPEHLDGWRRGAALRQGSHLGTERISGLVSGSNESGIARRITEHGSELGDQAGQAGARHVHLRPEQLIELVIGNDLRPALDQHLEQLVHLGLEGNDLVSALELSSAQVEHAVAELQPHDPRLQPLPLLSRPQFYVALQHDASSQWLLLYSRSYRRRAAHPAGNIARRPPVVEENGVRAWPVPGPLKPLIDSR